MDKNSIPHYRNVMEKKRQRVTRVSDAEDLQPCPCCGGKATIGNGRIYNKDAVCVKCTVCGMRTSYIFIDCPPMHDLIDRLTRDQAIQKAKTLWNNRSW